MTLSAIYLAESAVQAGVTHVETSNGWFFEQVNKVQAVVIALNLGAIFIGVKELVDGLEPWLGFYRNFEEWGEGYIWGGVALTIGWMVLAAKTVSIINNYFRPREDLAPGYERFPEAERAQFQANWSNSSYQVWMQGFHVTQVVMSVALVFFSTNPYFYGLSAALQLYSLFKTSQWKTIGFRRSFDVPDVQPFREGARSYNFSYQATVFPAAQAVEAQVAQAAVAPQAGAEAANECAICMDRPATSSFHAGHNFCNPCIAGVIAGASGNFLRDMAVTHIERITEMRNGQPQRAYARYDINFPENNLPCCPLCRARPAQNSMGIDVRSFHEFLHLGHRETVYPARVTFVPAPA